MQGRIRAGELRTPMVLCEPTVTRDNAGADVITWPEGGETHLFAKVDPLSGREWLGGAVLKDAVDTGMWIRYMPGKVPTSKWRMRDPNTGVVFGIVALMIHPKLNLIEMVCKSTINNVADGR